MNASNEWNSWIKAGVDLFMQTMKTSGARHNLQEIYSGKLNVPSVSKVSISSENADIQISFSSTSPRYTVLASKSIDSGVVTVRANAAMDTYTLTVKERSAKDASHVNVKVCFQLPNQFKSVNVTSKNGDITVKNCKSPKTGVSTISGDIAVSNHITSCTVKAKSKNGDVSKSSRYHKSFSNELVCKSENGDISIE